MPACVWCGSTFPPGAPGGHPRRFCGAPHRAAFHQAARRWALRALDAGLITVETLKLAGTAPQQEKLQHGR